MLIHYKSVNNHFSIIIIVIVSFYQSKKGDKFYVTREIRQV